MINMNKNIKRMFFVLTLVTLLATVGAVCAADDANTIAAVDSSSVSDVATVSDTTNDYIVAEPVTTTNKDNNVDAKTIEKEVQKEKNSLNSLVSSIKTVKSDDEEDILVITNDNYRTYGSVRGTQYNIENRNISGKTLVFSQDFQYKLIYLYSYTGVKSVKELPLNTTVFSFVGNDNPSNPAFFTMDGIYAPNTLFYFQTSV